MNKHTLHHTLQSANDVVMGLNVGSAAPTVLLLDTPEIHLLLKALADNLSARSRVALIGTSRWSDNKMLVEGYEEAAKGVITLR